MPIVQISKIIHRVGAYTDLPQLDVGELGFASDERRLFIGNDPILYPPEGVDPTVTEVLTDASSISVSQLSNIVTTVPTTSTSTGIKGQIAYDSTHLYVCVDTDTWIRVSSSSTW